MRVNRLLALAPGATTTKSEGSRRRLKEPNGGDRKNMSTTKTALKRLVAGAGALALAFAGIVATSTVATAAVPVNIDPTATGSIIIHKHVKDEASSDNSPAGAPLEGVTFRVTEVLLSGASVPLATAEGWAAIDGLTPGGIPGGSFTKGTSQDVTTLANGQVTASGLGVGLYLVEEIDSGSNLITAPAAPFLVTIPYPRGEAGWDYDVDVYPKNVLGSVTPTKTVGTPDKAADVTLGAVVPFTISVPVAQPALPYVSFSISDALSAGLEFVSWSDIAIGGVDLVAGDYTISADNATVTLTTAGLVKLNAAAANGATTVTATIKAKVTDLGQLDNKATATINGKPGTTPEVTTNWARLDLTKVDDTTASVLAGATFELWNSDKTEKLAEGTTAADGTLSFNVWVGNDDDVTEVVYLKETVAPQGYVLPADPWTGPITLTAGATASASISTQTIKNFKAVGPELPLTGAQGTLAMTLGGLLLVGAGTGVIAVSRRRRSQV